MRDPGRKIKILLLVPELDRGGPTLGAVALAKYLDKEQYEVLVGVLGTYQSASRSMVGQLEEQGIEPVFFGIPGWGGLLKRSKVHRFVSEMSVDIVNSYGLRPDIVNYGLRRKCLSLASVRGMLRQEYTSRYGRFAAKVITAAHIYVLRRMHKATALSISMFDYLLSEGLRPEQLVYIPNFVDLNWVDRGKLFESQNQSRHSDQAVKIGVIGSLIPRKRVDWVISACSDLLKKRPDLRLVLHIVGDGILRDELSALSVKTGIEDSVIFHGHIEEVGAMVAGLDLFVIASESEGMPRSLMEAMSLGKTCLAPNIGGVQELIIEGQTGYLFDQGSYDDLVEKLGYITLGGKWLDSNEVMRYLEVHFGAESGASMTADLFQELIQDPDTKKPLLSQR